MSKTKATAKYPGVCCAMCGSTVKGKGYFCSYRCDEREFAQRTADAKARYEAGRPIRRAR